LTPGAEPSAGFNFNIAMHGDHEEEVSGTELAAEWAFSSLQKFGQEFLKKLKGKRIPNKLLEKVKFVLSYYLFLRGDSGPLVPLLLLSPPFFNYFFLVHLPVDRNDQHFLVLAMASDFTVTWQYSQREHFLLQIKLHNLFFKYLFAFY
jgi:hypothetical protein